MQTDSIRTQYCGQLNASHINQNVTLCGWVNKRRDLGGMIFIDMRDREGIVQVFFDPAYAEAFKLAAELRNEFCIQIKGKETCLISPRNITILNYASV